MKRFVKVLFELKYITSLLVSTCTPAQSSERLKTVQDELSDPATTVTDEQPDNSHEKQQDDEEYEYEYYYDRK